MSLYSIMLALGALVGLLLVSWRAPQKERIRYLDAGVLTLLGALVGGRVFSIVVNLNYFATHPGEIFQIWMGGFSGIGALVGGVLMIFLLALLWRFPLGALADTLIPLAGTLVIAAWMGCWLDACSYGAPSSAWWALPTGDEWGVTSDRVPVQLIGALATLLVIWLLDWGGQRLPVNGSGAAMGLFGMSSVLFGLSYLRADPTLIWNGLRLDAWGALGLMAFSALSVVVLLLYGYLKRNKS
jgi:phosphatidylglycerol:prolipoprotein diacylglycerol transferase